MKLIAVAALVFVSVAASAQDDVQVSAVPQSSYDSIRSQYIKSYPDHFFVWPVVKQRKLDFELEHVRDRRNALSYKTNKPYSLGIGMYVFELGVEIAFAIPLNEQSKTIYGESDTKDIQINTFGKRWGAEAFYQKYKGFYIDDHTTDIPANTPYPQRGDIEVSNIGVTGNYVINSKKFSFRSAYNFAERQLRSAGTFVVFSSLTGFKASGDTAIIGSEYENRFGYDSRIRHIQINSLGVAPGYAYNLIYNGFFLNGTLALGPAHNWISYTHDDGVKARNGKLDAYVTARISIGYNGDAFFGGLTFVSQGRTAKFDEMSLSSSNTSVKILFGYRFKEFGFLKKRVWDIPKAIL